MDLGDLAPTRYVVVTATNVVGNTTTTLTFIGAETGTKRTVKLANNETAILDFGSVQNADGTGEFLMYLYPSIPDTNLTLDVLAVGVLTNR